MSQKTFATDRHRKELGIEEPKILYPRITRQSRAQHELTRIRNWEAGI